MPVFDLTQNITPGSAYGFSSTRVEDLDAAEYTLVGITADVSGSVSMFRKDMEDAVKAAVAACRRSPRADNLIVRVTRFDDKLAEVHGFRPLSACPLGDYDGCLPTGGTTALYDAAHNAISALTTYARDLTDKGLSANGIVIVITDGGDNASSLSAASVRKAVQEAVTTEALESVRTILVGVNVQNASPSQLLDDFRKDAGFDQYIELDNADATTLARLADFMSRAIRSQSVALGSGAVSKSLTF